MPIKHKSSKKRHSRSSIVISTDHLHASSSSSVGSSSLSTLDSPSSALEFVSRVSSTHSTNSSISTISLPPPASSSSSSATAAADASCDCYNCQIARQSASELLSSAADNPSPTRSQPSPTSPSRRSNRHSAFLLIPAPDPWSYRSAKSRVLQRSAQHSAQTLPTVDENLESEYVSFFDFS